MLKKFAVLLLVPLFFMAVYHYVFADSIFTDECQARILSRQALTETYGLNQSMQAYFEETLVSDQDGYTFVYYATVDDMDYVLGRYTVEVKGGQAKAGWSWDGKEIPYEGHGLAAHAWGKDQLMEAWLINKQTSNFQNYGLIARGIATDAGYSKEGNSTVTFFYPSTTSNALIVTAGKVQFGDGAQFKGSWLNVTNVTVTGGTLETGGSVTQDGRTYATRLNPKADFYLSGGTLTIPDATVQRC